MSVEPAISALAASARLDLPEERKGMVQAVLAGVMEAVVALEEMDLDAVDPPLFFDARWL